MKNVLSSVSLIISVIAIVLVLKKDDKKMVYVDAGKLFSDFELAKELNKGLDLTLKVRKTILDSIYDKMRSLTIEVKSEDGKNQQRVKYLAALEEEYYYKKQQFEQDNKAATDSYVSKVWSQLNQYIADYGKLKNYSFIFGANGQGNIMYAESEKNVTQEVLSYVNERYNDKIKK